jgi:hypothetical protein
VTPTQAAAIARLRKWSDRRVSGDPTKRMTQIWATPWMLCLDIRAVMELIDEKEIT